MDTLAQQMNAGLIAGFSATQVSGDNLGGYNKAGLVAGGFVSRVFSEKYSGQMEIFYIGKGSRKTADPEKGDYFEYRMSLHYIEVPVMLCYHYKTKFIFQAGPSFGTLLSSSEEDQYGPIPDPRPFYKTEFSFVGGLDYLLSDKLMINVRSDNSILPIRRHPLGIVYGLNRGQYNTVITFTLRYKFVKE